MTIKHRRILFVVEVFVLLLVAANARASTLSLDAVACADGSCSTGTPAASGGDVIPGATGIGAGVVRHQTEPGVTFDAFMNAIGAEDHGVFRGSASVNVFGEAAHRTAKATAPMLKEPIRRCGRLLAEQETLTLNLAGRSAAPAVDPRRRWAARRTHS